MSSSSSSNAAGNSIGTLSAAALGGGASQTGAIGSGALKPGFGTYMAAGPQERRDDHGRLTCDTPDHLKGMERNGIALITTVENAHPDQERLLEHWARQEAARRDGTYNPLKDRPVYLSQLAPTVLIQVNRVFSQQEAGFLGKQGIAEELQKLKEFNDYDNVPIYCGKPYYFPIPRDVEGAQYRDELLQSQMETFAARTKQDAQDIAARIEKNRAEAAAKAAATAEK